MGSRVPKVLVVQTATISARGEERLRSGHPWIYRSDVKSVDADGGDRVFGAADDPGLRAPPGRVPDALVVGEVSAVQSATGADRGLALEQDVQPPDADQEVRPVRLDRLGQLVDGGPPGAGGDPAFGFAPH